MDVHKLVGKQLIFGIVEHGLQLVGSGGGVDLVVYGEQLARSNLGDVVTIESLDTHLYTGAHLRHYLGKLILRQAEKNGDGLELRDYQQTVGVCGMHHVSDVHKTQPDASADRRDDMRVGKLQLCAIDLGLIGLDSPTGLANQRLLGIELLFGDDAFLKEEFEALEIDLNVAKLCLILGKLAFGLFQLHLVRTRINFDQGVALLHGLALGEIDFDDLAVHAGTYRNGIKRGHRSEA